MEKSPSEDSHSLYPQPKIASASLERSSECLHETPAASTQHDLRQQFASTDFGVRNERASTWQGRAFGATEAFVSQIWDLVSGEKINVLLVVVPVGIAVGLWARADPILVFILNALAIIPLAVIISTATESLASRLGDTLGALFNVTVGNAAELIIFFTALAKDQINIVQASLLGSILANSLLVLGTANICGGLRYGSQLYDKTSGRLSVCLLNFGIVVSLLPVGLFVLTQKTQSKKAVLDISRGISIGLVIVYICYLLIQMIVQTSGSSHSRDSGHKRSNAHLGFGEPQSNSPGAGSNNLSGHRRGLSRQFRSARRFRSLSLAFPSLQGHEQTEQEVWSFTGGLASAFRELFDRLVPKLRHPYQSLNGADDLEDASSTYEFAETGSFDTHASAHGPRDIQGQVYDGQDDSSAPANDVREGVRNDHRIRSTERLSPLPLSPPSTPDREQSPTSIAPRTLGLDNTPKRYDWQPSWDPERMRWPDTPDSGDNNSSTASEHSFQSHSPLPVAIVVLLLAAGIASVTTELAVDAIPALVDSWNISHVFLGFIVLPFVGNAAEHVIAAKMASKNRMVLAKNVAIESATQVVLFITPLIVLLGWVRNREMSLQFDHFEVGCILVTGLVVSVAICRGDSGWRQGLVLHAIYLVFAVGAVFYRGSS